MRTAPQGDAFDAEELGAFLDAIAEREATEIGRLEREYEAAARAMRTEARRISLAFHRRVAEETRTRIQSDYHRKMSRARSEFRRRRWEVLLELRGRAESRVRAGLLELWREPGRQLAWCRYWLTEGDVLERSDKVRVCLGRGTLDATIDALRDESTANETAVEFGLDDALPEGVVIRSGTRSIDGLLQTQVEILLEPIGREVARWFHERVPEPGDES